MLNTQLLPTLIALLACHEALTLPTATGRTGQHLATSTNSTGLDHIQQGRGFPEGLESTTGYTQANFKPLTSHLPYRDDDDDGILSARTEGKAVCDKVMPWFPRPSGLHDHAQPPASLLQVPNCWVMSPLTRRSVHHLNSTTPAAGFDQRLPLTQCLDRDGVGGGSNHDVGRLCEGAKPSDAVGSVMCTRARACETCPNANEEIVLTMSGQLKCCVKCPAGEGMLQLCTNHTQTVCRTCQEFSEFSPVASATAKCMQCKQCQELHPFAKFRTHCTPTSDAVCECIPGYFFVEAQSTCQSCTKCPPGHGAERPCDWNRDSLCKPCPAGTWSSSTSATETCQTCRKCKPGQIEMRPCSATHNTLCCPLHEPNCSDTLEMDAIRGRHCSSPALVVIVLCFWAFVWWPATINTTNPPPRLSPSPGLCIRTHTHLSCHKTLQMCLYGCARARVRVHYDLWQWRVMRNRAFDLTAVAAAAAADKMLQASAIKLGARALACVCMWIESQVMPLLSLVRESSRQSEDTEEKEGFYRFPRIDLQENPVTSTPSSNWISFSEKGLSHDLNRTLNSMKIKTAFRIDDEPSQTNRRQATGDQMPDHVAYGDDYPMITVYCSLLGLVILTLLIYVFYKLWQQHLTAVDAKAGMVEAAGGNALHPAFAELTKSRSVSAATSGHSSLSKQKASAASRPDCVRQHLLSESTQYSSLPQRPPISSELMEELSQALSADDRWKQVGGMLGYSDEALQRFENSSEHENDDVTKETTGATVAARRMLSSWFASRPSTETNPLESLISVIELIPGTANLCVLLKEYSSVKSPPPHPPLGQPH
ncbi:unnamed protein product [Mesocestoides corti]|uniref:Tumor necrosis factor receptor superfamily member 16 n=2 Tax=Mesocestoides corti TaxID=53468 RepID=A0A0R3U7P4_MESCO|nr:unnamed protein product [Mesocestoides corti]